MMEQPPNYLPGRGVVSKLINKASLNISLVCLMLFAASCGEHSKAAVASCDLAEQVTQSSLTAGPARPSTADERRVYLDASASMAGFVNQSSYSTFDYFIEEIGNALPGCHLYKYGQGGQQSLKSEGDLLRQISFGRELHNSSFYNLIYNPDDLLIEKLAIEEQPAFSVLITDGVYSESLGKTSPPVVDAIKKWLQKGRTLGVLILKSSFKGALYSERKRAMLKPVSISARPFYAFVFSPTEQEFRDLQEKLQGRFPDMQTIMFSGNALSCAINFAEDQDWIYSSVQPPDASYYWQMFSSGIVEQDSSGIARYNFKARFSPEYPVEEFKLNVATDYYRWEQGQFTKIDNGLPSGFEVKAKSILENTEPELKQTQNIIASETNDVGSLMPEDGSPDSPSNLVVRLPRDMSSDYSLYHLSLNLSVKSLRKSILDLSTRDDSVPENASKTFRFFELITALTDVHLKAQLAAKTSQSLFVTVINN